MRNQPMLQRKLLHLACTAAVFALATAGLTLAGTKPVLAEFEIQEAGIEKGEVELEYRGAYHWGLPKTGGGGVAAGNADEEEEGGVEEEGEEVPLRQSHDFEFEMGVTDWWLISTTLGTTVPAGFNWQVDSVELETQFQLSSATATASRCPSPPAMAGPRSARRQTRSSSARSRSSQRVSSC